MRVTVKLEALIAGRAPKAICDACLSDYLAISRARIRSAALTLSNGETYRRFAGQCSSCCTTRTVTRLQSDSGPAAAARASKCLPIDRERGLLFGRQGNPV